ncbi:hypothetical protein O7599_10780 [Streptomyces sp. WMMC500]|uniref:hypothetical protein n=1 Tax=Streptomyces sp. WMMC500 TaxID=3015154 RepID=UPI00248AEE53|nr:hypothetical protein [Streptomyces sp. WMMC500]WBB62975.1 hypothetical protein O7599_10780 [Streptomyces sp. WMMC500]
MLPDDHTRAPRRGPRHAAPRRPLLGRVPAGKAIALAAMPTAVFLGLGLTPRPAIAEDDPADRWRPGPCAEQSDEPKDEETADAGDASDAAGGEDAPDAGESAAPDDEPSPSPSASAGGSAAGEPGGGSGGGGADGSGGGSGSGGAADSGTPEEPSPSPSESHPWYDPLGLGDKIGDLVDPDEPEEPEEPQSEPEPEPDPSEGSAGSGSGGGPGSGAASGDERGETEKAIRDAAGEAGATVEELDDKVRDTAGDPADETTDPGAGDDAAADAGGKEPFPCPTADPEALADAALEPGLPLLPDDPWRLESTKLTLKGLKYHGIVEVKTYSGAVKKVLKYTADDGVDIRDLHQTVVGPGRNTSHVRADKGTTSTIRNGTVTMYTEELKGNLFGLIPLTFSPDSPPPLDLPFAFFTDVQVIQAGQFGGTLTVPGLTNTIE